MVNYRRFLATVMNQKPVNTRLRTMIWQLWWRGGTHDLTLDGHIHDILVTSLYLPQVSPDTHSKSKPKEGIDSWVSCAFGIQSWDRTPIREFVGCALNTTPQEAHRGVRAGENSIFLLLGKKWRFFQRCSKSMIKKAPGNLNKIQLLLF